MIFTFPTPKRESGLTELFERETSRMTSKTEAADDIAAALIAAHAAYWAACDAEGRAIAPAELVELGAPNSVFCDAYKHALQVEALAIERGMSWHEARDRV